MPGAVESAISASRGEVRIPLPIRSVIRTPNSCHGRTIIPQSGRTTAAKAYPTTTNGLRRPPRSERLPDQSFTRLLAESAAPSMTPRSNLLPPSTEIRNRGRSGKIISLATSFSRLAQPSNLTFRGSGRGVG